MTEKLKAEIEEFKEQCLQLWFCQSLADSYTNSGLFDHFIDENGKVFWMKAQARQLWDFWQTAKQKKGFVLVPVESVKEVLDWLDDDSCVFDYASSSAVDTCYTHRDILQQAVEAAQEASK